MRSAMTDEPLDEALSLRLDVARRVATEAATLLMSHRAHLGALDVHKKGVVDLVTLADEQCEALVLSALARAFPDDRIIGEEGGGLGPTDAELTWVVDPLDGTSNFVHGLSHFCVSIGLAQHTANGTTPVLGAIAAPAIVLPGATSMGALWSGARGLGATRTSLTGDHSRSLSVSPAERLEDALAATGFPYDRQRSSLSLTAPVEFALRYVHCVRRLGSAALDLALVADGTFGLYWEPRLKLWDFVAGAALVLEAGGRVTDLDGGPDFMRSCDVFASNGPLHEPFLELVLAPARRR
jgi:myo-inositol-1(or 4)-monophosphatase